MTEKPIKGDVLYDDDKKKYRFILEADANALFSSEESSSTLGKIMNPKTPLSKKCTLLGEVVKHINGEE